MADVGEIDAPTLELILHEALKQRDWPAVQAALHLLAVRDPKRCRDLINLVKIALSLNRGGGASDDVA